MSDSEVDAPLIDRRRIEAARRRIADTILTTPTLRARAFCERLDAEVYFKYETLQITGSFKLRGASNLVLGLSAAERARGVIAASAGNHAQGVAFAASAAGIASTIVMPVRTPQIKVDNTRARGPRVDVQLHGATFDEAYRRALALREEGGQTLVHPFDDDRIIAGQATLGQELVEQLPHAEMVLVPVGGGGLIAGVSAALRAFGSKAEIIGVQTEAAPAMTESFTRRAHTTRRPEATIAEGISVTEPGKRTYRYVSSLVDHMVTVSEQEIESAIVDLMVSSRSVVEGAGAAGVAALVGPLRERARGKTVVAILSGGNIDLGRLALMIRRAQARRNRLIRLRATLEDHPGSLATFLQVIADGDANVVRVRHDRVFSEAAFGQTEVLVTLEVRDEDHEQTLLGALEASGHVLTEHGREPIEAARPSG